MDMNKTEAFVMPEGVVATEETEATPEEKVVVALAGVETDKVVTSFVEVDKPTVKRPMFAYWEVAGQTYKLKLKTQGIQMLESKYKRNLMQLLDNMPSLSVMLEVAHAAMQPWHAGVKMTHVQALFDKYQEDGGSQISFFKDVFIEIYKASGFFTQKMLENLANSNLDM